MDSLSARGIMLLPSVELGFQTIYMKGDKMTNGKSTGRGGGGNKAIDLLRRTVPLILYKTIVC